MWRDTCGPVPTVVQSRRGDTVLLPFQCVFTGFVMGKVMTDTTALRCVYERFDAPSLIRHARDPRFMIEGFQSFIEMMKSRSRATLSFRPQANGQQERSVKPVMQSVCTQRGKRHIFLVHEWDAQSTLKVMSSWLYRCLGRPSDALAWRREVNRQQEIALEMAKEYQATKKARRHRPFRVKKKVGAFAYDFELPNQSGYRFYPVVHVSRLKAVDGFEDRPSARFAPGVSEASRLDFDEELLPEDSWEPDHVAGKFEVEAILDDRTPLVTNTERAVREFKVKWVGYDDPTWEPASNLSCGGYCTTIFERNAATKGNPGYTEASPTRCKGSFLVFRYRSNKSLTFAGKVVVGRNSPERENSIVSYTTLEVQDFAQQLNLLRLTDADDLVKVPSARDCAKNRQKKDAFGSSKTRQKPINTAPSVPAKQMRAIQIQANDSGSDSESDGSGGSDSDMDRHRRTFLAVNEDVTPKVEEESPNLDPRLPDRDHGHQDYNSKIHGNGFNRDRSSHCGSRKHSDLGCWRRVTCTKCGKRGHPSDHCLFVCRGFGELHDMGKCPMEEFYNQIARRSSGWNPIRAECSKYGIYAFVIKTSVDQVSKRPDLHGNTCVLHGKRTFVIASLRQADEYARSEITMSVDLQSGESRGYWKQQDPDLWFKPTDHEATPEIQRPSKIAEYRRSTAMDLLPGESHGYWKHHWPGKWCRQAKITDKIHNENNDYS
ncbi:hypothetical protein PHMEG_0007807 [Phytophthora megakarya]|uniref:Reverse transcriptase n=1 Tax=Phytophthora megakarya TaxID=4795 RepID=A0A225WMM3_9STRA|nr:hypothetical protein PHMEG_0007807 [Phytophthora megakarya]